MTDRRHRKLTDDEADLWRRAVKDAAPLPGRQPAVKQPALKRAAPRQRPRPEDVPVFDAPMGPSDRYNRPSRAASGAPSPNSAIDRATYVRLKKGRLPMEGRIDLHGMTAAAAQRNLSAYLRGCQAAGMKAVLVITGRGLDPAGLGRGVLKRETPHWLDALPDVVSGYGAADRKHGGAGALYVRLRRKDKVNRR